MNTYELISFILYFILVIGIGLYFFLKSKDSGGEKDYFLGGRKMNGLVAALSAGASDMSAWVLMGLPGSIYLYGLGQVWISVGLLIGTILAWVFVAPRLRRYSIRANDSITIPQFLSNRFLSKNPTLQVICAIIFMIVYCVYAASSIYACGTLFNTVIGWDPKIAMIIAAFIIVFYTFMGGFNAVCWTDFFQGLLMLAALMAAPIIAVFVMNGADFKPLAQVSIPKNYYNLLSDSSFNWNSISTILSGLGWGLGYFGMPHILIRYLSIRSEKEMKKSRLVGIGWTALILIMASVAALIGRHFLGDYLVAGANGGESLIFVTLVRHLFPALLAGVFLSAILAAAMSTADSQLLASSSAFASDIYRPVFRKNASDKEMLWTGRIIVLVITIIAFIIASSPSCKGIMDLVSNAWAGFGSAFGPVILLSLFWKRFTYSGAVAGICTGFIADVLWYVFLKESTGLYEIIPGFVAGLLAAIVVSLISKAPSKEITILFEKAKEPTE